MCEPQGRGLQPSHLSHRKCELPRPIPPQRLGPAKGAQLRLERGHDDVHVLAVVKEGSTLHVAHASRSYRNFNGCNFGHPPKP